MLKVWCGRLANFRRDYDPCPRTNLDGKFEVKVNKARNDSSLERKRKQFVGIGVGRDQKECAALDLLGWSRGKVDASKSPESCNSK